MRMRCLAAFDLDPTKEDALSFGARSYMSLGVSLRGVSGMIVSSSSRGRKRLAADVEERMEDAQVEAFDEDLFSEVSTQFRFPNRAKSA
jgi:hypothetical protein